MPERPENRRIPYFGDFVLFDEIGRGGMGVVYDAQQSSLDRPVALKILHSHLARTGAAIQRFRLEAETAARLEHPNIVPIYEVGEHDGHPYLAMQLVDGENLAERIAHLGLDLKERDAAVLMAKIARAVHHAHQRGVLHRDLKPGNILIDTAGEPHLIDFGLAKCVEDDTGLTQTGVFLGTPAYASPEQAAGQTKAVSIASDVYSLGAILYALLTGQAPFFAGSTAEIIEKVRTAIPASPRSVRPTLSANLETICLKCLEKEPGRRYASALELAEDLDRFLDGRPIVARPVGILEKAYMWAKRRPSMAALCLLAGIALLTAMVGLAWGWRASAGTARQARAMFAVQSGMMTRASNPRSAGWSATVEEQFKKGALLREQDYYQDGVAAWMQGEDAQQVAQLPLTNVLQLYFIDGGAGLLVAHSNVVEAWAWGSGTPSNAVREAPLPSPAVAFPTGVPFAILKTSPSQFAVWHLSERRIVCALEMPAEFTLDRLAEDELSAASSDARWLLLALKTTDGGSALGCWAMPSGQLVRTIRLPKPPTVVALSQDGTLAAVGDALGHVSSWTLATGQPLEPLTLSRAKILRIVFGPSVRRQAVTGQPGANWLLAASDDGGLIGIWDLGAHRQLALCRGSGYYVSLLAFSPDHQTLASGGQATVRLWDVATGDPLLSLKTGYQQTVLAFNADGNRLAVAVENFGVRPRVSVWELQRGRGINVLRGLSSGVTHVAFSPDGRTIAAASMGWELGVWDLASGQLLHVLEGPRGDTADNCALAFSPDGRYLGVSTGESAQLWDTTTGTLQRSWKLYPGLVDAMAYPAGDALYSLRMETLEGTEMPLSEVRPREDPRVFRLRNLLATNATEPIREIRDFNLGALNIGASGDGRYFAIEGFGSEGTNRVHSILAIAADSGRVVWRSPRIELEQVDALLFTTRAAWLGYTQDNTHWSLINLDNTNITRPLPSRPSPLGPDARLSTSVSTHGNGVYRVDLVSNGRDVLCLGAYNETAHFPKFDSAGHLLAWGTPDGGVLVCDLVAITNNIRRFGLTLKGGL